jgi:hypothetical protein
MGAAMPTRLPEKPRVRAIEKTATADKFAVWAIAVGFCAVVVAAIVYDIGASKFTASYILLAAAAIVAVILRWGDDPGPRG